MEDVEVGDCDEWLDVLENPVGCDAEVWAFMKTLSKCERPVLGTNMLDRKEACWLFVSSSFRIRYPPRQEPDVKYMGFDKGVTT